MAAGEPLLGASFLDEASSPVALVPEKAQPVHGSAAPPTRFATATAMSQPVDQRIAGTIAPTAWTFYRTLPDEPQRMLDLLRFSLKLSHLGRELSGLSSPWPCSPPSWACRSPSPPASSSIRSSPRPTF